MSKDILVIADHFKDLLSGITFEMLGKAREIADAAGGKVHVLLMGRKAAGLASRLGAADKVLLMDAEPLAGFSPEAHQRAAAEAVRKTSPWLVMVGATSSGWDLAAPLSAALDMPLAAYCRDIRLENGALVATIQLYGGKILVEVQIEKHPGLVSILPGSFRPEKGLVEKTPPIEDLSSAIPPGEIRTRFVRLIEPEAGDVDITQSEVLVSVGRGIQSQDNLKVAEDLARSLGGQVAASRPVIDQGWLPLTRQVGRSGMTVKPKLYLALGISGAPEHVEGMRDSDLIVAVNSDPAAPIFNVAHYGAVADVMEIVPALTARIDSAKAPA